MAMRPPRGTHDLLGAEMARFRHVVETGRRVFARYGFTEWETPIFEETGVFARSLGESSDVVSKEMYSFEDRSGDSLTLRPEGTAGICRALVTNGLTQTLPQRVFYQGPMFRYERPQKGRYREFHQIGAEFLGADDSLRDAETIAMAADFLEALGLGDDVTLELNTLGNKASRQAWREALIAHFSRFENDLSADSRARLRVNPLRILDSKHEGDKALVADAPAFAGYLDDESKRFWDDVRQALSAFGVVWRDNPLIVRGLDYYSHTAFEFVTDKLGAQGTVLAGGRYEDLVAEMGGPAVPAIGWAAGVERLSALIEAPHQSTSPLAILPMGGATTAKAAELARQLRRAGHVVQIETRGNMKKRLERTLKAGAKLAVFVGEEELAQGQVQLRNLEDRTQQTLPEGALLQALESAKPRG
ncbi:histidine--tRNA ligase [Formicincola oecophyllae]|uniref:Histidine--tRNA ligase n=1 Tax=Formicincola oecophyllae TaxID=2558361 RepID=A0A4Y6U6G2_9PROT|nr:histidine--tRNA ligase [Formicincola oecophyllae]QDH12939.1 histidine--tRNA ligase [Formicincola oecophyllae]